MNAYWIKTPKWIKRLLPGYLIWDVPQTTPTPTVYISFDDGPHPVATPYALEQLKKYNAKGTFFCIGNNAAVHADILKNIVAEGHAVGNHTNDHLNGWHTNNHQYLRNIYTAAKSVESRLFRPPYGRIKLSQARKLAQAARPWRIYMWDVLSGDFDTNISAQQCADNVIANIEPGAIVVFHDSEKAWERMRDALPVVLEHCKKQGWTMAALP